MSKTKKAIAALVETHKNKWIEISNKIYEPIIPKVHRQLERKSYKPDVNRIQGAKIKIKVLDL
jgi:hypothetical protein